MIFPVCLNATKIIKNQIDPICFTTYKVLTEQYPFLILLHR